MILSKLKIALAGLWVTGILLVLLTGSVTRLATPVNAAKSDDYVGDETCAVCHEAQAQAFAVTKHSKLQQLSEWKGKAKGCETCHGPGREHSENEGDKTKIISFKNKSSKEVSERMPGVLSLNTDMLRI